MKIQTPLQKLLEQFEYLKNEYSHLLEEEEKLFLDEIEDALKRGHALGYSEALNIAKGRPESSNAENAMHFHLNNVKETYFSK